MEKVLPHLYVMILAGGGGTRLWPQSREESPKQFTKLFSGRSLFEITLDRALDIVPPDHIIISTSAKLLPLVKRYAKKVPSENVIAEPMRRDTALAMGIGTCYAYKKDPQAVIVNMASDHLIRPESVFVSQIKKAASLAAAENSLVTIGITPRFPHPGLGHIRARLPYKDFPGVLLGEKFVEKPPLEIAEKYTQSGEYYWNTNLYVFPAKLFLDLLKKHSPKVYAYLPKLLESLGTESENQMLQLTFQMTPAIAIDYAVSEKLHKFICLPAKFDWTDVGDWKEVWNNLPKDQTGNVISGPAGRGEYIGIDSTNNLLFLDKKIVATAGVHDMVIVDMPDALLICPKNDAQAVKKIVQALKDQELTKFL